MKRRGLLALGGAAALTAAWPLRAFEEPSFETLEYDWADSVRQRTVPVRLYLPSLQPGQQRLPLVVVSHGIGGSRRGYSWLGTFLATHGMAALHLQHVGSDRQVWMGNPLGVVGRLQDAAHDREAIARAQDLRYALDQVLAGEHAARFDTGRIAAAGHSYGANTTLLASGARVQREGRLVDLRDERIRAAIVMSAPPFYGEREPERILGSVTLPTLHVTCTEDVIRIPGYYSGFEDRLAVFDAIGSARKWLAVFEGGSHSVFTDRAGTGGTSLNPQVKTATRTLALAFLRDVWDGDAAALRAWPREHSSLLSRFTARGA
jgi:predicted dienelactone hydrolase